MRSSFIKNSASENLAFKTFKLPSIRFFFFDFSLLDTNAKKLLKSPFLFLKQKLSCFSVIIVSKMNSGILKYLLSKLPKKRLGCSTEFEILSTSDSSKPNLRLLFLQNSSKLSKIFFFSLETLM